LENISEAGNHARSNLRTVIYIAGALLLFFLALEMMVSSVQHLSEDAAESILLATANPFVALFIGLLITAVLQSSSTTSALVVAFVVSGSLSLQSAVFIIMGANIGTTITGMIVSLGFFYQKKEFKRAVAAGSFHVFFNILTAIILFPLEYYDGSLSKISSSIAEYFVRPGVSAIQQDVTPGFFDRSMNALLDIVPSPFIISGLSLLLLFGSILIFRKLISDLLKAKSPEAFARFFFDYPWKSLSWGLLTTAAIRSSTITTSIVVPIVAKKIASLRQAAPFVMGANVGTTVTAFIAASVHGKTYGALSIALSHFLFNLIGVFLFMAIPGLKEIPLKLSAGLGNLTLKYRMSGFAFLLLIFFLLPFLLIYFNR
jgi:solute carrier family 34 (sodium-dependent phosphate cotransporter)